MLAPASLQVFIGWGRGHLLWGRGTGDAPDFAAPENIYMRILEKGVPRKNFGGCFPDIPWAGEECEMHGWE